MNEIVSDLKKIQANSHVMYLKMHNYHWNVGGIDFMHVHEYLEGIYTQFGILFDDIAERILQLNEKPLTQISEYASTATIKEDSKTDFDSAYVMKSVKEDVGIFIKDFKTLSEKAGKVNDSGTVMICEDQIATLEKQLWMIKSMLK